MTFVCIILLYTICGLLQSLGFFFFFLSNTIAWLINIDHFLSLNPARVSSFLLWTQREAWLIISDLSLSLFLSPILLPESLLFFFFSFFSNLHVLLLFRAVLFISMKENSSKWLTSGLHLFSAPPPPAASNNTPWHSQNIPSSLSATNTTKNLKH